MRTSLDYSGGAVVQGLTLQSMIDFSRVLVPAQCVLWVCFPQRHLGDALAWSELNTRCANSGAFWEGPHQRPSSDTVCALPRVIWQEPQGNPQMAANYTGFGGASRGQAVK